MASEYPDLLEYEYSWKSSGLNPKEFSDNIFLGQKSEKTLPPDPIGINLPLTLGSERSGIFQMSFDTAAAISTNLRNLVMTNHGERLGRFRYGANLGPLCAEYTSSQDFESDAMRRIQTAVEEFLPSVILNDFSSEFIENTDSGTLIIKMIIGYDIPALSSIGNKLKVSFTVI